MPALRASILALLFAAMAVSCTRNPGSDSRAGLFEEAGALYQKGDYGAAEEKYGRLIERGARGGALWYNIGNASYKQKKLGRAIFYWEKARRQLPADRDVMENLQLADLLVVDRIEVPQAPLPLRWLDWAVHRLPAGLESRLILALFILANGLFAAYQLVPGGRPAARFLISALVCAALVCVLSVSLGWKLYEQRYRIEGVVVEPRVEVRSGPGTENVAVFTIHEGTRLQVRGRNADWLQVSLPNGWSGWVPSRSAWLLTAD